ncbi:antitoxin (DNA-binding transcriptional repressor) of toxin-antitoxin stability system [Paraburkholderia sp. GAS42]
MTARHISVSAAKAGVSRILVWVKAGREFIVCRAGTPVVHLVRPAANIMSAGKILMRPHRTKGRPGRSARTRIRDKR